MAAVTFLGTGAGNVVPGRFQSSLLLETSRLSVLLDAGEPCAGQLVSLGFSLSDFDAVWITHAHSDHVGGLPLLLQASWLHGRQRSLPLGVPRHLAGALEDWLRTVLLPPEVLGFPLEVFSWQEGAGVSLGDLTVTPHHTTHLASFKKTIPGGIESFLFDLTLPEGRLVYTGDLGSSRDLLPVLDRPIDFLICELAHLTVEELIAQLQPARIGTLCLTHLSGDLEERRGEIKLLCEQKLSGTDEIYLPDDGERIEF